MRAGPLRHTITILQNGIVQDAMGGFSEGWSEFKKAKAEARDIASSERYMSQSRNSIITKKFFIRYMDGITADMRISYDGKVYDIDPPVDLSGKRRMLEISATEVISG